MSVAVVDFGAGNLQSVVNALAFLGAAPSVARTPEAVLAADRLVLPGVGGAGEAMQRLRAAGLDEALDEAVRRRGRPLLGICLGMQLLAARLKEFGDHRGLGWLDGEVVDIRERVADPGLRVPHMGWNGVAPRDGGAGLFATVRGAREFYFAHSFTLALRDGAAVAACVTYGAELVAAIRKDTVFAVQFHPEKSQDNGERLLAAFLEWKP